MTNTDDIEERHLPFRDGHHVRYLECGAGRPLVFIHGWTCNAGFWRTHMDAFAPGWRVIAPDLPGHGGSAMSTGRWTIDALVDGLEALMEELALGDAVLVGHSLGGAVALETAVRESCLVTGVVMVDSFVFDYGHLPDGRVEELLAPFRRAFGPSLRRYVRNATGPEAGEALNRWIAAQMRRTAPEVALPLFEALLRWDALAALRAVRAPVHAMDGPLADPHALCRIAPHVRQSRLDEVGHFPMLEDPERFSRALNDVLASMKES